MTAIGIPARVRDFLVAHLDSIEQLEILLLLAAQPHSALTTEEVSDELRTAPSSASNRLAGLRSHRLIELLPGDRHRLRADAELVETLRLVAEAYRDWRVSVVGLIYSRSSNVRASGQ